MLGMDHLHELCRRMDRWKVDEKESLTKEIFSLLTEIYDHPSYQDWLVRGQHRSPADPESRYYLHPSIGAGKGKAKRVLDAFSIIENNQLQLKIDKINGQIHLTDAPWISAAVRVFAFKDESQILCDKAIQRGWHSDTDILIDPACGCGHHMQGLPDIDYQLSFDVSSRALVYCRLNALLAERPMQIAAFNDLKMGMPDYLSRTAFGRVLFLVNMPFAIFPDLIGSQTPAQDGGDEGIELTVAAMKAISSFIEENTSAKVVRCLILTYSLGSINNKGLESWRISDLAEKFFVGHSVDYEVIQSESLWRVNGKKEQPNPMPVDSISLKSKCTHTYPNSAEQREAEAGYRRLIAQYKHRGYTHLSYGVISVEAMR